MKRSRVCYIADMGHHYREPIFRLMAERIGCHFYFGNKTSTVKKINHEKLPGFKGCLQYKTVGGAHYLVGAIKKIFKYDKIILLGDPHGIHNWIIGFLGIFLKKDIYLWSHGWYGSEPFLRGKIKKVLFRLATKVLVYGPRAKSLLVSQGFAEDKICVVYNSLDYDLQNYYRSKISQDGFCSRFFPKNGPVIVYVGRIQKVKRLDYLIKAIFKLKSDGHYLNLVFVGATDDNGAIKKLVQDLNLNESVFFYGPCYDEEILCKIISSSDVCVSPGNVGLTAVHVLNYGCPVITHDKFSMQMPEFESIIQGKTGDFFRYGDIDDLASKILQWASKKKEESSVIKKNCYSEITNKWNPYSQIKLIAEALEVVDVQQI